MKNANKVSRSFQHMILLCGCLLIYYSVSARQHKPTESGYIAQKTQGIDSDYVLIFNSYSESAPWCRSLVDSTVMDLIKLSPQTMTVTQNLNSGLLRDEKALAQLRQQVDVSYHDKPRMIIYIGSTSWPFLHETIEKKWGKVPSIIFSDIDYTGPIANLLRKTPIAPALRIPYDKIVKEYEGALSVVYMPIYLRQSLALMHQLTPPMTELCFISDTRWISAQMRADMAAITKTDFPELKVRYLISADMSTLDLLDSLQHYGQETGVLFFSWLKQSQVGDSFVNDSHFRIIISKSARQPLFVLNDNEVNTDSDVLGGYFPTRAAVSHHVRLALEKTLAGQPGSFQTVEPAQPVIDYLTLIRKGISPDLLPSNTHIYWKPDNFFHQYRYLLGGGALIVAVLLLIIYFLSRSRTQQRKVLTYMAQYRNLFENMPIPYLQMEMLFDQNGRSHDLIVRDVNPAFEKAFYSHNWVVGRRVTGQHTQRDNTLNLARTVLGEKRAVSVSYYFKQTDTHYTVILAPSKEPNFIDVFYTDNTALVRAQQLLRTVNHKLAMALEISNITPWKWDLETDTILCDVNCSVELMGGENIDENRLAVPETAYFAKIHKEDRERIKQAYRDLIEGKVPKIREEYRVADPGRSHFDWVEVQAAVDARDAAGKPLTLIGSSLVISIRKQMEQELISAKEKAEESSRLKSAFLANMSHEIRTPLNAIVGFSNILATTDAEEEKQEYVSIIENNNNLLLQLINDILDLSKIEAGTLNFTYTETDLNRLLEEIVHAAQMRNTSDQVDVVLAETVPGCIARVDRNRLTQVLTNLTTNALKFTQRGSIRIGYRLEPDGKFLYFHVSDTGCGIPTDKQKSVFERFVKLNSFSQGTGLGLSICQTIVEHVGGRIGVESEEGKGSNFWFTIPYRPVSDQKNRKPQDKQIEPIPVERDKLTILVAEDSADNFKLFETILKKDYTILHAWDGREAVELFKTHQPHLVLMDINMPVLNGYEATAEIRKLSERVPIIAVTAYAYASDEERIMNSGFDAYVPKPLNASIMRSKIVELLKKRLVFI